MRHIILCTLLLLGIATAPAASLDLGEIPKDAAWLVHLDAERLKSGELGAWITEKAAIENIRVKLEGIEALTGFNPLIHLASVTLGGPDLQEKSAVLYLRGQFDSQRLEAMIKLGEGYTGTVYQDHVVHAWVERTTGDDGAQGAIKKATYGCFVRPDLAVLSESSQSIKAALDTLDGRSPSLAAAEGLSALVPTQDAPFICLAAAQGLKDLPGIHPRAAFLKKVEDLMVVVNEAGSDLQVSATLAAGNDEDAQLINDALIGLRAVAVLNEAGQPAMLNRLITTVQIKRSADRITLSLQMPIETLTDLLETHGPLAHLGN